MLRRRGEAGVKLGPKGFTLALSAADQAMHYEIEVTRKAKP